MQSWIILEEGVGAPGSPVELTCDCGFEGEVPTYGTIDALLIATFGMRFIFEPAEYNPPPGWLPKKIQCRKCKRIYEEQ